MIWDGSPYVAKVENALALKGIPYSVVQIPNILPRPEISDHLGIAYRRVPVLAIGNDVYCDTSAITATLERRFPEAQGYGTLFPSIAISGDGENAANSNPKKDTGLIKAFVKYYIEATLVPILAGLITWSGVPEEYLKDRADFRGAPVNIEAATAAAPLRASALSSHLSLVEEQLADGREYLFGTTGPSLADSTLQAFFSWARPMRNANNVFNSKPFPLTNKWLDRVTLHIGTLKASHPKPNILSGAAAAAEILSGAHDPYEIVGFDEREAERLNVKKGDKVNIAPEDTGRNHPTAGKLVALNREEFVLEVQPKVHTDGVVRVHFPRLGFSVTPMNMENSP
ncbi:hypothetical protein D9619_000278 [Psilocybe cf. subviscida]|uniref:GST N-terminal domain-containing protein n=1 Tax=Psilocybe cf. subviscida TaxID=2480587 RepID=A0A8H5BD39_9AGAR|nr:hypothetical protein D9619_000278 [Psilocybe cf. subviscida]